MGGRGFDVDFSLLKAKVKQNFKNLVVDPPPKNFPIVALITPTSKIVGALRMYCHNPWQCRAKLSNLEWYY